MITQADIDALKRIKEQCSGRPCIQCPLYKQTIETDCLLLDTEPAQWRLDNIKPDATDSDLCQTVEIPAIKRTPATPESIHEMFNRSDKKP